MFFILDKSLLQIGSHFTVCDVNPTAVSVVRWVQNKTVMTSRRPTDVLTGLFSLQIKRVNYLVFLTLASIQECVKFNMNKLDIHLMTWCMQEKEENRD